MIKTDICDLLQIEYTIFQGGMAWLGTAELAAAVSEAFFSRRDTKRGLHLAVQTS